MFRAFALMALGAVAGVAAFQFLEPAPAKRMDRLVMEARP